MIQLLKQPGETLRHPLIVGGVATIAALVGIDSTPRGLVAGSAALVVETSLFAGALTLTLSGGSDGERYLVTATVDDADGERREEEIEVAVIDLAWAMPDGGDGWLSIAEFVARFGLDEVVRMTDARGDGRIDKMLLVSALIDAQAIAEAHVGARYQLPLDPVPMVLKGTVADLARGRLYPNGAPEGIAQAAKAATRSLEKIQAGTLSIAAQLPDQVSADGPILVSPGRRAYPDGLADY